jgi:hypothetical protein
MNLQCCLLSGEIVYASRNFVTFGYEAGQIINLDTCIACGMNFLLIACTAGLQGTDLQDIKTFF